jgi:hypothetical protein
MVTGIDAFLSSANEVGEGFFDQWRSMQRFFIVGFVKFFDRF